MIDYWLGIDGGGTGTRALLALPDGTVLGRGHAGPSALGQGVESALRHVQQAIASTFENAGIAQPDRGRCAIGAGLSGIGNPVSRRAFEDGMAGWGRLVLETDAFTMLLGAHQGRPGAMVAAGTGSVGEVLRADGTRFHAGGWGFPAGDEGSGAWIGLRAMAVAQCAMDGRAESGPLAEAIWSRCGSRRTDLQVWCANAAQFAYAQLAPLVFDVAFHDAAAEQILVDAAHALEALAHGLDPAGALPLAICGSVGQRLQSRFEPVLRARAVAPWVGPAEGALLLLRNL